MFKTCLRFFRASGSEGSAASGEYDNLPDKKGKSLTKVGNNNPPDFQSKEYYKAMHQKYSNPYFFGLTLTGPASMENPQGLGYRDNPKNNEIVDNVLKKTVAYKTLEYQYGELIRNYPE